ncbi:MAG: nucleotide exchange factor GrpE [Balneolaceae bacterium]|nr:MAG: nucleotide exchange factor GrpE [Balneolaceae bacterium]
MSVKQDNKSSAKNGEKNSTPGKKQNKHSKSNQEPQTTESAQINELDELIEKQQVRIQELEEELAQLKDTQLRKAAEMENTKRRLQRERDQIFQISRENAVLDFLPVSDDLLRTLYAMKNDESGAAYLDGIRMVAQKFDDILEKHGVTRINEAGVPFDVELHDALLSQKAEDESIESGTVLQVIENGYRMGEKTLRHAKVIVSQ